MNTPTWLNKSNIKISLDARPLLMQGIHPLEQVFQSTSDFKSGEIFEIITPFPPTPMIEKMEERGFATHSEVNNGLFSTYFCKM